MKNVKKKFRIRTKPVAIRKVWGIKPHERVKKDERIKLKEKARRRENNLPQVN
jgi:hypothetical protein